MKHLTDVELEILSRAEDKQIDAEPERKGGSPKSEVSHLLATVSSLRESRIENSRQIDALTAENQKLRDRIDELIGMVVRRDNEASK